MKRNDLIDNIMRKTGLSRLESTQVLSAFTNAIIKQLGDGQDVKITMFGSFVLTSRAAHRQYDIYTQKIITVGARKGVHFRPSPNLKLKMKEA